MIAEKEETKSANAAPTATDLGFVNLIMAVRGLSANKLRAFLTMLGVIIGVGAVIIAIAIGEGSREAVAASLRQLGTNVLTVFPGQGRSGGIGFGAKSNMKLEDAEAILKNCPSVARVSPQVNKSAQMVYKNHNTNTSINGTGVDYPEINNHPVDQGRYFNAQDVRSYRRVVALGSTVATTLFSGQSAVGKNVLIAGQSFQVIAVLRTKGGMGFRNPDDGAYVPVTTAMRRLFGMQNIQTITCQAKSEALMSRAQDEIDKVVRKQHKIASDGDADFMIFNQADLSQAQNAQQDTFSSLITYLAIVSLFVGGIGIMNIMLVSVTERTREIGIRKAIGAKRRDILTQFMLEALLLSLIGGILGVVFGVVGAQVVQARNGWTVTLAPTSILLSFSFSAIVGVFFGFYPALKASKLNPIEALRYE